MEMEVSAVVGNKAYWEVTFEDIAEWWILGVRCGCCSHKGPIDRAKLERRCQQRFLRFATRFTVCKKCGNRELNSIYIAGKLPR